MTDPVAGAYAARAAEYAERLGTTDAAHPADLALITSWADGITGQVLDAGCGPGHWTAHLASLGLDARGVDLVPARIGVPLGELARVVRPGGGLLVGAFAGPAGIPDAEPFDHAVTRAWRWDPDRLADRIGDAGFAVEEVHARTAAGQRPHLAIRARRRPDAAA